MTGNVFRARSRRRGQAETRFWMSACTSRRPVARVPFCWLGVVLLCGLSFAGAQAQSYPSLRDCHDPTLQRELDAKVLSRPELRVLVENKNAGAVLVDVAELETPRVAWYNPDLMMYAASLPKIAIALGAFVEIDAGRMTLDDETKRQLIGMIKKSSNRDATAVLEKVGILRLAEILQDPAHGALYDPAHGGGLWVGKPYGKGKAVKRDPLHGLSHGATALAAARFYYGALNGTLIDHKHLPLLREMFGEPGIAHKFVKGLKDTDAALYRKSGTWRDFHSDSALVVHPDRKPRYIVVGIGRGPGRGQKLVSLIRTVDDMMVRRASDE